MVGRRQGEAYNKFNYESVKINNKHAALCKICKKHILNTGAARLRAHRNICPVRSKDSKATLLNVYAPIESEMEIPYFMHKEKHHTIFPEDNVLDIKMEYAPNDSNSQKNPTSNSSIESISSECLETSTSNHSSNVESQLANLFKSQSKKTKQLNSKQESSTITAPADSLTQAEEDEINESLAQFFFGCNIPLNVVGSVYFKNFVKRIRPAYAEKIPGREVLSTKLLDKAYEKCLYSSKTTVTADSVLLINSFSSTRTVISMFHNMNGETTFLDAWNLTEESEMPEFFISESIDLADKMYSTKVYAVVLDNASAIEELKDDTRNLVWKSYCSIHIANLLAEDLLNRELNLKVVSILKEYKQPHLEKKIIEKGGSSIKLPYENQWCSYRNAYQSLIENIQFMKLIYADSEIKSNNIALLFDTHFIDDVRSNKLLLDQIFDLINKCETSNCSAAEAVEMWLNLQLSEKFSKLFKARLELVFNKYALTAYDLHPFLDNTKLSSDQKNIVFEFLFKNLDGAGLEEWDSFKNKTGFFQRLYEKNIKKPLVFWNMAEMKYPNLAKLAKKLLHIPASSAQIERMFLSCIHAHSTAGNPLTFQQLKKLLHIYHSLKIKDDEAE